MQHDAKAPADLEGTNQWDQENYAHLERDFNEYANSHHMTHRIRCLRATGSGCYDPHCMQCKPRLQDYLAAAYRLVRRGEI